MRILVTVSWAQRLGGSEEMLQMALEGAAAAGQDLDLVFFEAGPWARELTSAGFHVEVIPAGRLRQPHRMLATIVRLAGVVRRRRPDLILNWSAKAQLYGSPAAVLAGMGDRVTWFQQSIPSRRSWLDVLANLLPARAVGCYSQAAAQAQARLFPARETFVIAAGARISNNGSAQVPPPLQLAPGVPVVGLVGRLQPWKGQHRLLRAQALLRERGREIHTVIVGGDAYGLSREYAESLPGLIERLGLTGAVTLTGQVSDPGPYIAQMDILVNASDPEPFGIVLLEGMAAGVAVLAVDSGGPAEIIEDGRTGVLSRSGEPEALADALERLLSSPELRGDLARAGRERFLRDYTDTAMCKRFYDQLERFAPSRAAQGRAAQSRCA